MGMLWKGHYGAMNTKIMGSGETTLVLAHGYGGDQSVWDDVIPDLTQSHRVVVFDWNFSGAVDNVDVKKYSTATNMIFDGSKYSSYEAFSDDLIALLDELELEGVVYVGHSMAGMIGCIASLKRPRLFHRLVLLGASPRYLNSPSEGYEGGFERPEIEGILSNIESDFQSWAGGFSTLVVGANNPIAAEKFHKCLRRMRPETALSLARTVFLSDWRSILEEVQIPCTIIQTSNDIVVPISVAYYMQEKMFIKASLEIIACDGHFPQLTESRVLLEVLNRSVGLGGDLLVKPSSDHKQMTEKVEQELNK